ncbi:hypothetical protein ABTZ58_23705 [Streptomyces sp. NPDC094143]|uniref:hypothetical protein n=1 Tax=Streptomyces sp. NPDC094143 TaxID=3155310 RepID=UPI00331D2585
MDCEHTRHAFAARLLNAREEPASAALEAHLHACGSCRVEYEELSDLPPLLGLVEVHELDGVPLPDPQRAIDAVRAEMSRAPDTAR